MIHSYVFGISLPVNQNYVVFSRSGHENSADRKGSCPVAPPRDDAEAAQKEATRRTPDASLQPDAASFYFNALHEG